MINHELSIIINHCLKALDQCLLKYKHQPNCLALRIYEQKASFYSCTKARYCTHERQCRKGVLGESRGKMGLWMRKKKNWYSFGKENVSEEVPSILKYSFWCKGDCEDA